MLRIKELREDLLISLLLLSNWRNQECSAGTNGSEVRLNNNFVGTIAPYPGANPSHWFMQMINITGGPLLDGNNELQVNAAPNENPSPGNIFEDFQLKNVICIFQQST